MKSWSKGQWMTLLMGLNVAIFGVASLVLFGTAVYIASGMPKLIEAPWWLGALIAGLVLEFLFASVLLLAMRKDERRWEQVPQSNGV